MIISNNHSCVNKIDITMATILLQSFPQDGKERIFHTRDTMSNLNVSIYSKWCTVTVCGMYPLGRQ